MVEERVQRRFAALLAADMVGYNQMAEDEAGALTRLKAPRADLIDPTITEHTSHFKKLGLLAAGVPHDRSGVHAALDYLTEPDTPAVAEPVRLQSRSA